MSTDRSMQSWIRLWRWVLVVSCAGMLLIVLAINWAMTGFHGLGLRPAIAVALMLGTTGATSLGVILMGLLFYSERMQDEDEGGGD